MILATFNQSNLCQGLDSNKLGLELLESIKAVGSPNVSKVKELIQAGANVNDKDINESTALIYAASYGHTYIEKILRLEEAILNGENLENINKLNIEDIRWYIQRFLSQLRAGNTKIYDLLPKRL